MIRRLAVFGPAFIVVLTGVLSYHALHRVVATRDWVQHTRDVLDASSSLFIAVLDGETGQRGYLLTRDTTYLAPHRGAEARAAQSLEQLRALTVDNPHEQVRLDTLTTAVNRRFAVVDSTIQAAEMGEVGLADGVVAHGPGRMLMTEIRRLIAGVNGEESQLLVERQGAEKRSMEVADAAIVAGTLIAGLLAFLVNGGFDLALEQRQHALTEVEAANEKLQDQTVELEQQAEAAQSAALEFEQASDQAQEAMRTAEEAERRAERLQGATEAFTGALSLVEVSQLIVDQTIDALGAQSGALMSVDPGGEYLRFVALHNVSVAEPGDTITLGEFRPMCLAVRESRPVISENWEHMRHNFPTVVAQAEADEVRACAVYPMTTAGTVVGAIVVRFTESHVLSAADRSFMHAMSRIGAEAFERARLFDAERTARSAAESANRAKAAFLASMSHELRTPLQAALGFAQLVRSEVYGPINETQAEALGRVERSQTHLARLIDDILDFARLEAGHVRMTLQDVALNEIIADIAPLVEPQAAAKNIELTFLPPPDSLRVTVDRHRLEQILVNIVGNAIKFTPECGTIRVGALYHDTTARIQVRDTGIGIPEDRLQAIFDPFVQVEDGLTRTASGTGLGLAISRDLARAMGGDVTVESELGKGSIFSIVVPSGPGAT